MNDQGESGMDVSVIIDDDRRTNFVTWTGCVRADDILQAMTALHEDPNFKPDYHTLCDYTAVHDLVMSPDDMNRLLAAMAEHDLRCGRTAMVMPTDRAQQNVGKVMSRALEAKGSEQHRIFTRYIEAEVWLGLRKLTP